MRVNWIVDAHPTRRVIHMIDISEQLKIGEKAPEFEGLLGVDGARYSLSSFSDKPFLTVIFSCNGCPTVKANEIRMIAIQNR